MTHKIYSIILGFLMLASILSISACGNDDIDICQKVSNGSFIQTVNGKDLICTIENTTIDAGKEVVLNCTNETNYNATINIEVNGEYVGTISNFPTEFRYQIDNVGLNQFSITGTLKSKSCLKKFEASFSYSWNITIK